MGNPAQIHTYGIRHHGAGSARNLIAALDQTKPDIILIECPADCQTVLPYVRDALVIPPVAILAYNKQDIKQCAYYPFTLFSPEWQAIQSGLAHGSEIRFFDLPQGMSFKLSERKRVRSEKPSLTVDPFAHLASLAGFDDPERWWDTYIEQQYTAPVIFDLILELMQELREAAPSEKASNLVREAFMRQEVRRAIKEGYRTIAIVCGAWHAPAVDPNHSSAAEDAHILKKLKSGTVEATWVPWSYNRIARHTGYQSGVISPYWYEALFTDPDTAIARWMSRAAAIMNEMGHSISPAHVIEGTRMSVALAGIRSRRWPGISELFDAIGSVYCHGDERLISIMRSRLLEGEKVGFVSDQVPMVPLQQDLEAQIKKARLSRDWRKQGVIEKHFDLRKPTHLAASRLLHRMDLLGIQWGEENEPEHNPLGNFHEYWTLQWYPDYEIYIIEASMWGNTVEEAAVNLVLDQLQNEDKFEELGQLLYRVLHAHLPKLIGPVSHQIRDLANLSHDVQLLMKITPPLIWSLRYGDTAQLDTVSVRDLLDQLIPRICVLLPAQTRHIHEEVAVELFHATHQLHQALQLADLDELNEPWLQIMPRMATHPNTHGLIKGMALRISLLKKLIATPAILRQTRFELSSLADPFHPAFFLEGLLHGGGWLLIHRPLLRTIVNDWMISLPEDQFMNLLPVIRRTFATFSDAEKSTILQMIRYNRSDYKASVQIDAKRRALVVPAIEKLL